MFKQIQPLHNANIALKLFDTLVLPILSYGGVVWGPLYARKITEKNLMSTCNDMPIERMNVKLCKYLLGVHRKSTNDAVRGELGRFPLLITILNHSFQYFRKIEKSTICSLAKISCLDNDIRNIDSCWYNCMNRLTNTFNQSRSFLSDLQNVYRMSWTETIKACTGKLRTYSLFKKYILHRKLYHSTPIAHQKKSNQTQNKRT